MLPQPATRRLLAEISRRQSRCHVLNAFFRRNTMPTDETVPVVAPPAAPRDDSNILLFGKADAYPRAINVRVLSCKTQPPAEKE
jgi:hypothetical protein